MAYALTILSDIASALGLDTAFVPAMPTALMKPLSGSGARGLMIDTLKTYGVDSFVGRMVSIVQGSTETTFYVLALYYGSVGVRHTRYSLPVGLAVDAIGVVAAIFLGYLFFG
jgi:spore maturation protein SpmB